VTPVVLASKRLDLLKKLAPAVERVAFLYDPTQPAAVGDWAVVESAAPLLALHAANGDSLPDYEEAVTVMP
jgi:hypothetical protein